MPVKNEPRSGARRPDGTITAVERAFAVVRAVAASDHSVGVSAIARITDLPKSTVARLLATLESLDVVERADDAGRYRVGGGLAVLAGTTTPPAILRQVARPYLRDLVSEVGEDAGLAVADGEEVLYIDQVSSESPVQVQDWTGLRFPYHVVAAGFVLMADWPADRLDGYLRRPLESSAPGTETAPAVLAARVARAREDGYAWTHAEWAEDVNGAAAPIRDSSGRVVAAINLYGPGYRFPGDRSERELGELLAEAAGQVGELLLR